MWRGILFCLVASGAMAMTPGHARAASGVGGTELPSFAAPSLLDEEVRTFANPGPHDRNLLLVLSRFDEDACEEELAEFGPNLREQLEAIALDSLVPPLTRVRAVAALSTFDDQLAFERVAAIARDAAEPPRVRMGALWTLGNRFESHPGRESVLAEALREPDYALRLHAVLSLIHIGGPEALEILDAHRMAERHVSVRELLREVRKLDVGPDVRLPDEGSKRRLELVTPPALGGGALEPSSPRKSEEVSR